jgi:CO dehydrogenase nickel-insertion accessory protein CooC1
MMEERRKQAEERAKIEKVKLAEILMPHQMKRLEEIYIQVLGVRALQDPDVVRKLGITARQKEQIEKVQTEARERNRSQMESLSQSGDREQIRETMTRLRKESDDKVLAVLTAAQKATFAQMKGEPLELPEDAVRGGGGGRDRGRGGGGGGNRDRGRGQRGEAGSQRPPAAR